MVAAPDAVGLLAATPGSAQSCLFVTHGRWEAFVVHISLLNQWLAGR